MSFYVRLNRCFARVKCPTNARCIRHKKRCKGRKKIKKNWLKGYFAKNLAFVDKILREKVYNSRKICIFVFSVKE